MARGGKRNGAGRKPGSRTMKTREVAERLKESGLTPLQVMMEVMQHYHEEQNWDKAAAVAKDAAPYCHPRLQTTTIKGDAQNPMVVQTIVGVQPESVVDAPGTGDEV